MTIAVCCTFLTKMRQSRSEHFTIVHLSIGVGRQKFSSMRESGKFFLFAINALARSKWDEARRVPTKRGTEKSVAISAEGGYFVEEVSERFDGIWVTADCAANNEVIGAGGDGLSRSGGSFLIMRG